MSSSSSNTSSRNSSPEREAPPLDSLVSHLLASKRSLSSISHVVRANELVTSTRKALETNVITTARTDFLRSGIDEQVKVLEQVHTSSEHVAHTGRAEFEDVIRSLDEADERLKRTLRSLRETFVEAGLRPEGEEVRSLLDFVDESGVEALLANIRESVSAAGKGHLDFAETNRVFVGDVLAVKGLLKERKPQPPTNSVDDVDPSSPIPDILETLEDHAREMADNLESLVKHFDLCVSAIKHTEGGGDAAQRIAGDLPEGVDIDEDIVHAAPEPISGEDMKEMLEVIEKDADQVDEVVTEIQSRIAEMESQHESLIEHMDACNKADKDTTSAFRLLEDIGQRLPPFIAQSQVYLMRWDEEKARVDERMQELEGLREFYDGFLAAYDNLLVDIGRRKTLELKVKKVVQDALNKIERLYENDAEARDAFRQEQGDFLPVDIWPGMTQAPLRYELSPVGDEVSQVPEVSKSVIQRAVDRVTRKSRATVACEPALHT